MIRPNRRSHRTSWRCEPAITGQARYPPKVDGFVPPAQDPPLNVADLWYNFQQDGCAASTNVFLKTTISPDELAVRAIEFGASSVSPRPRGNPGANGWFL